MSRVLTFARTFPKGHPRQGEPTGFIEKLYASWADTIPDFKIPNDANALWDWHDYYNCTRPKHHTIRAGHHWKAGDWFSPRVWSGVPYNSKQITIAPDIQIPKTWDFEVDACGVMSMAKPGEQLKYLDEGVEEIIASNDGLDVNDFYSWIVRPYSNKGKNSGPMQILCWNENIEY